MEKLKNGETMSYKQFLLKKEILIKNYTEINLWNVMGFDEDKGQITIFFFDSKKERDLFIKGDR